MDPASHFISEEALARSPTRRPSDTSPQIRNIVDIPIALTESSQFYTFRNLGGDKGEHFAIRLGTRDGNGVPLVRLHSECVTGDVFGSLRCDCGNQLDEAVRAITKEGGYLLYLRQEGRGIGLYAKLDAYVLAMKGRDTFAANEELGFEANGRDF